MPVKTPSYSQNIVWHHAKITRQLRESRNQHRSILLWFTGLSGSGKSTLAYAVEEQLFQLGLQTIVLDGDNIRHGLCDDLGFSDCDRHENIRRIGETAKLLVDAGIITIAAFISPFEADRDKVRKLLPNDFIEIYCQCSLDTCEARDTKGLYLKARTGEIKQFTGVTSSYEIPENPEIILDTEKCSVIENVSLVIDHLYKQKIFINQLASGYSPNHSKS